MFAWGLLNDQVSRPNDTMTASFVTIQQSRQRIPPLYSKTFHED
jgi:hypothetical protein